MVSVVTKPPLVNFVEALYTSVLLLGHQVFPKAQLDLPRRLDHKGTHPLAILMSSPLRSFSTNGGGLHVLRTPASTPLHTKSKGRRFAEEPLSP
jgi:hypothetical protein